MRKLSNITFKVTHQGQALVEYAILLFLLVTLFVGGTELGLTALASNKNTEAAKTGISEYAEVNQQRLNLINSISKYSANLSLYCPVFWYKIEDQNNDGILDVLIRCSSTTVDLQNNGYIKADYVGFLMNFHKQTIIPDNNLFNYHLTIEKLIDDDPTPPEGFFVVDQILDTNSDGILSATELNQAELNELQSSYTTDQEKAGKEMRLINVQLLKLALLPLNTDTDGDNLDDISLTFAKIAIGDTNAGLQPPSCNGNTYEEGFPTDIGFRRYLYAKYKDATNNDQTYQTGDVVYLFNPLPINVTSCIGADEERDGLPRIRILIDGYTPTPAKLVASGKSFEQLFVPGLPKLNQAMYSNYENVCVNDTNNYVSCSNINVVQRWLKPPGKICFSNTEIVGVDSCIGQPNTDLEAPDNTYGPTGFYFFGNPNDSAQGNFEYTQNQAPEFRPAIQVECSATPNSKSDQVIDSNCSSTPSKLRIHTRYRRVFDGFLSFGLMKLTQQELLPYFYNPSLVGVNGTTVVGSYGSEVGPLSSLNGPPTIKHFMDFRGCYEVDVETNQISACN